MIKKKFIEFLFISLLVLFIGSFSTSYAWQYTITDADIDTIFTGNSMGSTWNNLKTYTKNYKNTIYQTYDTCVIAINYYNSRYYIYMYGFNSSSVISVTSPNIVNYMGVTLSSNGSFYQLSPNSQNFSQINVTANTSWLGGANFGTGSQNRTKYLIVPNDLGNNLFTGPWQSSNIIEFGSPPVYEVFEVENFPDTLSLKVVENWSGDVYYASRGFLNTGVLTYFQPFRVFQLHNLHKIIKSYYAYDFYNSLWYRTKTIAYTNFDENLGFWVDNENDVLVINENKNQKGDIIEVIDFIPYDDTGFTSITTSLYYGSGFTKVIGDYISLTSTFSTSTSGGSSGDANTYYGSYDSTNNTESIDNSVQDINESLTDDSEVDGMLASFSGDATYLSGLLGLPTFNNPFSTTIENIFNGVIDVLLLDGDVQLDFGFGGKSQLVNSSDFTTPANHPIVIVLNLYLIYLYVYYMIELGYKTIINIREFNLDKSGRVTYGTSGLQPDGSWRLL